MDIPTGKKGHWASVVSGAAGTKDAPPGKKIDLFSIAVLNALSAHVAVIDADGRIIAVNDAWERFARDNDGDARAVSVGANYFEACRRAASNDGAEAAQHAVKGIESVLNHTSAEFELEYDCHSPTQKRWYIMRATPMHFKGSKAVISHIDISEKKRTEERLVASEKELEALSAIGRSVHAYTSVKGVIQAILSQISKTLQPDLAMVFLKEGNELMLKGIGPDSPPTSFEKHHSHKVGECLCGISVSTEKSVFSENIQFDDRCTGLECKKAGFTSFTAIPLKTRDAVIGTLGIASITMRDFQHHHQFLEAMANDVAICLDNASLYEEGKAYARDLEVQLKERKEIEKRLRQTQKVEAIGKLAGGIAHDFNNILSPILGYTEMAIADVPQDGPVYQGLMEVLKASHRARDLVQQILTFTRQTEGGLVPIDMSIPVKEAATLLRSSLPSTIRFLEHIPAGMAPIQGDATQIYQIVMNLGTNAAHAMEKDGGTLEISLEQVLLDSKFIVNYKILPKGFYIKLTISDTGTGMTPQVMESIFDPYYTTKSRGRGTGLGLTVVQGITKTHKGEINVYSEPGEGTTFTLYFPAIKAESVSHTEQQTIEGGTEAILLVDDEASIAQMGRQILQQLGYSVTIRTHGEDALQLFKEGPDAFDLVITDMTMPNMTGDLLSEKISRIRPDIAIILCTGFSRSISKKIMKNPSIVSVLSKPFATNEIARAVREAIDQKRDRG